MKQIRLLPVVIFAALALLLFKGIGLVTHGGYVLTGPQAVFANEGAAASTGEIAAPSEAVLTDTSPTLGDNAPTMATKAEASSEHDSSEEASGEASGEPASGVPALGEAVEPSASEEAPVPAPEGVNTACPTTPASAAPEPASEGHDELTQNIGEAMVSTTTCPPVEMAVNEHGDALPVTQDGTGKIVPLDTVEGDNSEEALTARLAQRRAELDTREADLDMRTALVEAAEKKLAERTAQLEALQAQLSALVDAKQAAEEAGFKAIVSMYETMKPKEAAKIFDSLELPVLLKVARAMNPRKMGPILAVMSPRPAQVLTAAMAATENTDTVANVDENLTALPQIVGQ